jgi:hypothetical protein
VVTITELCDTETADLPSEAEAGRLIELVIRRWGTALEPTDIERPGFTRAVLVALHYLAFCQRQRDGGMSDRSLGFFSDQCARWHREKRGIDARTNAKALLVAAIAARVPFAMGSIWPSATLGVIDFGTTRLPCLHWRRTLTAGVPEPSTD